MHLTLLNDVFIHFLTNKVELCTNIRESSRWTCVFFFFFEKYTYIS